MHAWDYRVHPVGDMRSKSFSQLSEGQGFFGFEGHLQSFQLVEFDEHGLTNRFDLLLNYIVMLNVLSITFPTFRQNLTLKIW